MLNDDKTEFLIIGTRQQLSKISIQSIKIGQTVTVCPILMLWIEIFESC